MTRGVQLRLRVEGRCRRRDRAAEPWRRTGAMAATAPAAKHCGVGTDPSEFARGRGPRHRGLDRTAGRADARPTGDRARARHRHLRGVAGPGAAAGERSRRSGGSSRRSCGLARCEPSRVPRAAVRDRAPRCGAGAGEPPTRPTRPSASCSSATARKSWSSSGRRGASLPDRVDTRIAVSAGGHDAVDYEALVAGSPTTEPPDADVSFDDLCLMPHTSGTTSRPKGVMLTHANLTWNVFNLVSVADFRAEDVTVAIAPFFRSGGTGVNVLPVLFKGGTSSCPRRANPRRSSGSSSVTG